MNKSKKLTDSFNNAVRGLLYAAKSERNMKIHIAAAFLAVTLSLFFKLNVNEIMFIVMSIVLVLITELFNTAVEILSDAITQEKNRLIRAAKDICAGAVLISAMFSILTGYIVFHNKARDEVNTVIERIRESPAHLAFLTVVFSISLVIVIKLITKKGTPLKGGFPSGHSAVAFSLATAISIITKNIYASLMAYLIAIMVAQSRMKAKIHSFLEILFGGILGVSAALLIFKLLEV